MNWYESGAMEQVLSMQTYSTTVEEEADSTVGCEGSSVCNTSGCSFTEACNTSSCGWTLSCQTIGCEMTGSCATSGCL